MQSIPTTIAELEAEVLVVEDRRARLVSAIATLQALQVPQAPARSATPAAPRAVSTPAIAKGPASRSRRDPGAPSRQGQYPSVAVTALQILEAVRTRQPITPKGLWAAALGLAGRESTVMYHTKKLIDAGQVVATGSSNNRMLTLPGHTAAAPAEETAAAVDSAVSTRDAAVLARLKAGRATFDQLLRELPLAGIGQDPDSKRIALKQSLRRLTLKGAILDVGEYFKAA